MTTPSLPPSDHREDATTYIQLPVVQPPIRQSGIKDFFTCQRKFMLRGRFGIIPKGHKSAPFIGSLFHLAQNCRYKGLSAAGTTQAMSRALADYLEVLKDWMDESGEVEKAADLYQKAQKEAAMAMVMAELHWELCPKQAMFLDQSRFRIVALEKEIQTDVPGIASDIAGRLDMVVESLDPKFRGFLIPDHKTSSDTPQTYADTSSFDSQVRLYRLLAASLPAIRETRLPVLGFIHNVVRKPTIKVKQGQTYESYLEECRDWYLGRVDQSPTPKMSKVRGKDEYRPVLDEAGQPVLEPRWDHSDKADVWSGDPPMTHFLTQYHEDMIPLEFRTKLEAVNRACRQDTYLHLFPRTGVDNGACRKTFGSPCPYLPICSVDPKNWGRVISDRYTTDPDLVAQDMEDVTV